MALLGRSRLSERVATAVLFLVLAACAPAFADEGAASASPAFEATATYYAKRFHGRRTSSGARYASEGLTAAHGTLPFGTRVRVRNLANDREVVVTINDRCRKRRSPVIDLSRAAARELGFLRQGRARVRVTPLAEEPVVVVELPRAGGSLEEQAD